MSDAVGNLVTDLIGVVELVDQNTRRALHRRRDKVAELVTAIVFCFGGVCEPFVADVEFAAGFAEVCVGLGLAKAGVVILVGDEGGDQILRCRSRSVRGEHLGPDASHVGASVGGWLVVSLLDIWREPSIEGIVARISKRLK